MNRKLASALVLALIAALSVVAVSPALATSPDSWSTKASPPIALAANSGQAVAFNGRIYAICGSNTSQFEMYDPSNDTWIEKTPLPASLNGYNYNKHVLAVCGDKIYAIGGGVNFQFLQAYDPVNNSWEYKARCPSGGFEPGFQAAVVGSKIFVLGGINGAAGIAWALDTNYAYDTLTDSWSKMSSLPISSARFACAVIDDKIYVVGGYTTLPDWSSSWSNAVQIFDPQNNSWSLGAPFPHNMSFLGGGATTGLYAEKRLYVFGGHIGQSSQGTDWTQIYNPETGSWSFGTPMLEVEYGLSIVNVNDTLYALGGAGGTVNEMYTPADWSVSTPSPSLTTLPSPSASVPEFPTWTTLLIIATASLLIALLIRKKTQQTQAKLIRSQTK